MNQDLKSVQDAMARDSTPGSLQQSNQSIIHLRQSMPPFMPLKNLRKESVMRSEQINELAAALAKAQSEISGATKDTENTFFKSKYADLASIWTAIREPLSKNGLCVIQTTNIAENNLLILITTLLHSSGQWIAGHYPINPIKNDPQGIGSASTYARRYALAAIVGAFQVDDDGEGSMNRNNAPTGQTIIPNDVYRIPFGKKHIGKSFEEMGYHEVRGYLEYLQKMAKQKNENIQGDALVYSQKAEKWLGDSENEQFQPNVPSETF